MAGGTPSSGLKTSSGLKNRYRLALVGVEYGGMRVCAGLKERYVRTEHNAQSFQSLDLDAGTAIVPYISHGSETSREHLSSINLRILRPAQEVVCGAAEAVGDLDEVVDGRALFPQMVLCHQPLRNSSILCYTVCGDVFGL